MLITKGELQLLAQYSPTVIGVLGNIPVLGSPSDVRLQTCKKCPLACGFYGSFKMFKISASEFGTVGMRRQFPACTDELLW